MSSEESLIPRMPPSPSVGETYGRCPSYRWHAAMGDSVHDVALPPYANPIERGMSHTTAARARIWSSVRLVRHIVERTAAAMAADEGV